MANPGVLLISHGTVDALDDLPPFLTNIRRGHAPSPELLHEVRRRYEAIGGHSPLNRICTEVATKLEARLGLPVTACQRLWKPDARAGLEALAARGVDTVVVVPLAQHSAPIYGDAVVAAAEALAAAGGPRLTVKAASNWGAEPRLTEAYAGALREALAQVPEAERSRTLVVLSAHSLPVMIIRQGDPYEDEVRKSAAAVAAAVGPAMPEWVVAFQSQGMSTGPGGRPMEWLGPDLEATFTNAKNEGKVRILLAPIGFLADHVEILYDLDIEARAALDARGLAYGRTASLNAGDGLLGAVEAVARRLLP